METSTTVEKVDPWELLISQAGHEGPSRVNEKFAEWLTQGPRERDINEWWRWQSAAIVERLLDDDEVKESEIKVLYTGKQSPEERALIDQINLLRCLQQNLPAPLHLGDSVGEVTARGPVDQYYDCVFFLLVDKVTWILDDWSLMLQVIQRAYKLCPPEFHLFVASVEIRCQMFLANWKEVERLYTLHGLSDYEMAQCIYLISRLLPFFLDVDNARLKGFVEPTFRLMDSDLFLHVRTYAVPIEQGDSSIVAMAKLLSLRISNRHETAKENVKAIKPLMELGRCGKAFSMWFMLSLCFSRSDSSEWKKLKSAMLEHIPLAPKMPDPLSELLFTQICLLTAEETCA